MAQNVHKQVSRWDLCWACCSTPQGLEDVSKYPQLLAALLEDPSWREEDLKKLAGLNLLRVFRDVEEVCFRFSFSLTLILTDLP
jgi:microsomal dipeptidase-like Zn-dependent dipeptidase